MSLPILQLRKGRERSILHRHPWIFSGAMQACSAEDGDIVAVQNHEGEHMGYAFFSEHSQIVGRMFEWSDCKIDQAYWDKKIENAFALRANLRTDQNNAYRLLHAEGDFFPGIIADVYSEVVVLQLVIRGTERIADQIVKALGNVGFNHVYLRLKNSSRAIEKAELKEGWLLGNYPSPIEVIENGNLFEVDFIDGQKTGFFLDQRDNRALVGHVAKNKTVLNAFSYSGGFSVYALQGGAKHCDSVDISAAAIEQANKNVELNQLNNHEGIAVDCFEYLSNMPDNHYDLIVLDPPAFAKHKRALKNATRGYKQINMKAIKKIKPGGLLFTYSCSQNISKDLFQKIIFGAAADVGRNVRIVHQLHQPSDHPINIYHPEGEYLKGLALYIE